MCRVAAKVRNAFTSANWSGVQATGRRRGEGSVRRIIQNSVHRNRWTLRRGMRCPEIAGAVCGQRLPGSARDALKAKNRVHIAGVFDRDLAIDSDYRAFDKGCSSISESLLVMRTGLYVP